jgi:pimeloyl-ACP methyl ester carboxylesterase
MKSLIFAILPLFAFGCSDKSNNNSSDMAMPNGSLPGTAPTLAIACTDQVTDVHTVPSGLPAMDMTHRGDILKCAVTESLNADKVNSQITAYNVGYTTGTPATEPSGFWSYRFSYRTLRNTPKSGTPAEGDSAAFLLIPEKPLAGAPLVVFAHGSTGVAAKCAPSLLDLSGDVQDQDYPVNMLRLAGYGYTVVAPDYSGYIGGQPPGYFNAEDEAHSVLDATRAAANLLPTMPDKVVIVGHSQGGHAALSAQSFAKSYGMKGTLAGVAVFAPLWTSMALWAAGTTTSAGLTTDDTSSVLYLMEYAYSAGALRGDTGDGLAVFQSAKQQAAKDTMLGGECYDSAKLKALGSTPSDFFDTDYVGNVGLNCAANSFSPDCTMAPSTPAGDAPLWKARWAEDRPKLDDQSAPILVWYGGKDATVKPGWAECARERFASDLSSGGATTTVKFCFDPNAAHRDIIRGVDSDYVNQWISFVGGIGSDPGTCGAFPSPWADPDGKTTGTTCEVPPNDY